MSAQTPVPPAIPPTGERGPRRRRWWLIALIVSLVVIVAAVAIGWFAWVVPQQTCVKAADPTQTGAMSEYCPSSPHEPYGGSMTIGSNGAIWYNDGNNKIAGYIPQTGSVTEFDAPTAPNVVASNGLVRGSDGNIWYIANDTLGRISTSGAFKEFALPKELGLARAITGGPEGTLWVAMWSDDPAQKGGLLRIPIPSDPTQDPVITQVSLPANVTLGGAMAAEPDGSLWMATGTTVTVTDAIVRITPAGAITQFSLTIPGPAPSCGTQCQYVMGLTAGPDGNMWFIDGWNHAGKITPAGIVTFYRVADIVSMPSAFISMSAGPDGNIWFASGVGTIGRLTPDGVVTKYTAPHADGNISNITAGPDGGVWYLLSFVPPGLTSSRFVRVTT